VIGNGVVRNDFVLFDCRFFYCCNILQFFKDKRYSSQFALFINDSSFSFAFMSN
jgi:hypothetical protein